MSAVKEMTVDDLVNDDGSLNHANLLVEISWMTKGSNYISGIGGLDNILDFIMGPQKNSCPWDECSCSWNGHLECLKYPYESNKAKLAEKLFGHSSLPKKNKKQEMSKKKEKLSKSKNRGLKR